jgi:hypothetical protein
MYLPDFFTVYLSGSGLILPKHRTITSDNTAGNFGDSLQRGRITRRWMTDTKDILVCNDDIVFTPYTWPTLAEDLKRIPAEDRGWVATRSDYARGMSEHQVQASRAIEMVCTMLPRHPLLKWM